MGGNGIEIECCDGKRRYRLCFLARSDDGSIPVTGKRPRRRRGAGEGTTQRQALGPQALANPVEHHRLAAEKMAGARYIQQKTARAIQRHKGGEAIAPIGDPGEQLRIGRIVRRHNLERGQHGAGIGKRLTDGEPQRRCLAVHRRQVLRIVHLFHHDERRPVRLPGAPLQPVSRKARKPQRHDPPRGSGSEHHHNSTP